MTRARNQLISDGIAMNLSMKNSAMIVLKTAVTVGALVYLVYKFEAGSVFANLRAIAPSALMLAAILVLFQCLLAAVRWQLVMRLLGLPIALLRVLQIFWIGQFATVLLPGGVAGDGVRMWVLARDGVRTATAINSVIIDRSVALTGLFLLVAASLPFADDRVAPAPVRYALAGFLIAMIATGLGLGLSIRVLIGSRNFRAARAILNLSNDLRAVCRSPCPASGLVALSILGIGSNILTMFVLVHGAGAALRFTDCMVLAPLVMLMTTLPISLGGWGVREGSTVGLFSLIGVPATVSLSASILIGLLTAAVSVPGVFVWLHWSRAMASSRQTAPAGTYAPIKG